MIERLSLGSPGSLGAPGIYRHPMTAARTLAAVRMDVCAFVGVAPRGPAREPAPDGPHDRPFVGPEVERRRSVAVAVESFEEYRRLYGGFEGPGLLPYAVASFFEQGGARAYVVRTVHDYGAGNPANDAGTATGPLPGVVSGSGEVRLRARNDGSWGTRLRAALGFSTEPLIYEDGDFTGLHLDGREPVQPGSLLTVSLGAGMKVLRFITSIRRVNRPDSGSDRLRVEFDAPLVSPPRSVEVVTGVLDIDDGDGRTERHTGLGLSSAHPRWLATVLCNESGLVWPEPAWAEDRLEPGDLSQVPSEPRLPDPETPVFDVVEDRYGDIVPSDHFDAGWHLGDPDPGSGVYALTHLQDLATVTVPDLYSPEPIAPRDPLRGEDSLAGAEFSPCVVPVRAEVHEQPRQELLGLRLDPGLPAELEEISLLHERLVGVADLLASFVVLLDVPPGISHRRILEWRPRFRSSYSAAYHPWLVVSRPDDARDSLIRVNPSAAAAGIIAAREIRLGVPHGPANEIAFGITDVDEAVSPLRHDELHPLGVNVFLRERGGVRLSAARTLSRDPRYRQLSVRRLMMLLERTLLLRMRWAVFEPNGPTLRRDLTNMLRQFLARLYRAGAFTGATEAEAYFVKCDDENNPSRIVDAGRLIAEIGVAPAEPLEFIVLRIARVGDELVAGEA